ncbi:MAG: hypothetical protein H0W68_10430, partial [Gemmatimonadaceae bacterium]|nr:hypothetical protein [Gemmatimonadaceae bacterium]
MKTPATLALFAMLAACATPAHTGGTTSKMSFFITSAGSGRGADLGGLAGADARCRELAEGAGSRGREWRAYLS